MASLQRTEARQDLALFVRERRGRTKPQDVGLASGGRRRTPGLRREEVAHLAGVSVTWYTWFEQGRDIQVSTQFLDRVCVVFRLDAGERAMLFKLAQHQPPPARAPTVPTLVTSQELASAGNQTTSAVNGAHQALVAVCSAADLETYRINEAIRRVIANKPNRPTPCPPAATPPAVRSGRGRRWVIGLALLTLLMLLPQLLVMS